jgi:hypothetical protein
MADEIRQNTVTVPAGTPDTAPLTVAMAMPPRRVEALQVVVPAGPSGLVGFAILVGGVRVIPYSSDLWIITSGENITWPLENYPDAGSWSVQAYNTGTVDHSIYFRWLVKYVTPPGQALGPTVIDESDINALAPSSIPLS